jgi:cytochrome c551/c552
MKVKLPILAVSMALLTTSIYAQSGEELFNAKCSACHSTSRPTDMSKVVAPAIMGVMNHIKMSYPKKDEAIVFMKDYIMNPSKEKAICMPTKIERFGIMPSQKGLVTEEELDLILPWIFDTFPPKGFRGMGGGMMGGGMQGK